MLTNDEIYQEETAHIYACIADAEQELAEERAKTYPCSKKIADLEDYILDLWEELCDWQ
mgnify:CR=1 FL=1|jgi:hypothetical protein|tara:strand:- start:471 stop:647 length:177 start_codon:yes stop_codon:yes gene_type:complete